MDFIAGFLELTGLWVVGNRNRFGFILNLLCGCTWIAYVIINKTTYGLLIVVVPALVINTRNFIKWTKESKPKEVDPFYKKFEI